MTYVRRKWLRRATQCGQRERALQTRAIYCTGDRYSYTLHELHRTCVKGCTVVHEPPLSSSTFVLPSQTSSQFTLYWPIIDMPTGLRQCMLFVKPTPRSSREYILHVHTLVVGVLRSGQQCPCIYCIMISICAACGLRCTSPTDRYRRVVLEWPPSRTPVGLRGTPRESRRPWHSSPFDVHV